MYFLPIHKLAPYEKSLEKEKMKSLILNTDPRKGEPPADKYILFESYCCDKTCDCRKVMINVGGSGEIFAVIGYGWEDLEYYTGWFFGDKEMARSFKGPSLELGGVQSIYADFFLNQFKLLIKDVRYNEDLERHYHIFKNYAKNIGRNDPCLCSSGRKAKKCCFVTFS